VTPEKVKKVKVNSDVEMNSSSSSLNLYLRNPIDVGPKEAVTNGDTDKTVKVQDIALKMEEEKEEHKVPDHNTDAEIFDETHTCLMFTLIVMATCIEGNIS